MEAKDLALELADARESGLRLVLCHGCFDLLHVGHVRHLTEAGALGDCLVVSLTADEYISKGIGRPYFPLHFRMEVIAALEVVDYVVPAREATSLSTIDTLRPDVYVKGPDYLTAESKAFGDERARVESLGGKVAFTSSDVVNSSTALLAQVNGTKP